MLIIPVVHLLKGNWLRQCNYTVIELVLKNLVDDRLNTSDRSKTLYSPKHVNV